MTAIKLSYQRGPHRITRRDKTVVVKMCQRVQCQLVWLCGENGEREVDLLIKT